MSSTERLWLGVALGLGALVRVLPVAGAAAGVGDGGLFFSMVEDIRAGGFGAPETTTYNELGIPFSYPPLALVTAAAVGELAGVSTLDVVSWMPVIVAMACLGAFARLAARVLSPPTAVVATLTYALMPHAYDWVIAGGGLTRGVGLLFALLAMGVAADHVRASMRWSAAAGVLLGLSALTHPQAAIFGVLGCVVLSWQVPARDWLPRLGVGAATAAAVVAPWLVTTASVHGLDTILGAGHRLEPLTGLVRLLNLRFAGAAFMDVFAIAGGVGLITSVVRVQMRLPLLLLATYLAGAGGGEFLAAVPWALLAGVGGGALLTLIREVGRNQGPTATRVLVTGVGAVVLFLALIASLGSSADRSSKLHALSADHLAAMAWVAANTPDSAEVIVATTEVWGDDEVTEWFPALAERHSIGTVQGSEWLGFGAFRAQLERHVRILECAGSTAGCYRSIDREALLFVPKGRLAGPFSKADCCAALRETLPDDGYEIVYDGVGATIARPHD